MPLCATLRLKYTGTVMVICISLKRLILGLEYQGASQCFGPAGDGATRTPFVSARVATFHQPSIRIMEDSY
jgi:hypothetical protein